MTPTELDRICAEAMRRLLHAINRSAGQHRHHVRAGFADLRARIEALRAA